MLTVMDYTTPAVFGSWLININKEKWMKTSGYLIVVKKIQKKSNSAFQNSEQKCKGICGMLKVANTMICFFTLQARNCERSKNA